MTTELFHPLVRQWFEQRFGQPTEPQQLGWPHIAADRNTLIAAPTGSGKTLAAFLVFIDRLYRQWRDQQLREQLQVVYISPLKALSNDIERNLRTPLAEISRLSEECELGAPPIRVALRTGDTPARERQAMLRRPPHILVTTPESLYLLLTAEKSRERLRSVRTVIVDEIHALARDKRGSHLALSLERLAALCERPPVRIGLSATQRPIDEIANFLIGASSALPEGEASNCQIIDTGHVRDLDLALEVPPSELAAVCSHEQWAETYQRLVELINSHRSTLIFVNTRRLAERVTLNLTERLGENAVASHHGSLSREIRLSAESRLKAGELKAIVATASLEMGIDIGYIDLVCQIGSPRSIATFVQRVGRSGHSLGRVPKGRMFPLTRDELLECLALVRAVHRGDLDRIEIPRQPLDILAQQTVAEVASQPCSEDELLAMFRRAWPYRNLSREDFDATLTLLSDGMTPSVRRGAYLHRDRINGNLRARRGARLAAITSGGAIPETADYRVVAEPEKTFVGTVDEDFAVESVAGDVFLLGNTSWRIRHVRGGEVAVYDAEGAPPTIPFWFGEAPGRTVELSHEVSRLRRDIGDGIEKQRDAEPIDDAVESWLKNECGADAWAAEQALRYVAAQRAAIGLVPTDREIVFERFFDESGGMQLVIHAPLGARINRACGLALRKRFCRSFDFELQAAAIDNGIVLSLGPQHSLSIDQLFKMIRTDNARHLLEQALLAAPMFQVRWRWNVTRSLAVLRRQNGKKVPPYLQRYRSDDLLAAAFPEQVGCLENHHGDVPIPNHPLVRQTVDDCMHEAMDLDGWLELLAQVQSGEVTLIARGTREPSPFCHEILNANPYAFLDDAPLEERRTRAVATRRSLSAEAFKDLAKLDPEAILQVRREAWPLVRDADELHDALMSLSLLREDEAADWVAWCDALVAAGRAARVWTHRESLPYWTAAERLPLVEAVYPAARVDPQIELPAGLRQTWAPSSGWVELVRGRVQHAGPTTAARLAELLGLDFEKVQSALEALEGEGAVLRGRFFDLPTGSNGSNARANEDETQWCDRRLLARIHRLTLDGLRRQIQPVAPADFVRFLIRHQQLLPDEQAEGPFALREVIGRLQGFEMPAGAWESRVLAARLRDYDPQWLDGLFLSGEVMWGRLRTTRRDENDGPSMVMLTRVAPISLILREDLSWLLPAERPDALCMLRANAAQTLECLEARGALFFQELKTLTGLLPTHLEESLRELAALGLATSDSFSAVRAIVSTGRRQLRQRRRRPGKPQSPAAPAGRWSRFPGAVEASPRADQVLGWCHLLLNRYGVLFRELLTRESAAPPWHELAAALRRLELRGEVRGGRFVAGVAGEQFATETAVRRLRQVRDEKPGGDWLVISAADPLNLIGVITDETRIPATHKNRLILKDGRCVACKIAGRIDFFTELDRETESEMRRALQTGRRYDEAMRVAGARLAGV